MMSPVISSYVNIGLISLLINIPLGYMRAKEPKFSFKWFLWIHASIPLIIYLRIIWETSKFFIPVSIFLAILGQIWGSRLRSRHMSAEEKDMINQIQELKLLPRENVLEDKDTMIVLLNMGGPRSTSDVKPFLKRIFLDPIILRFPFSRILQPIFAWLLVTVRGHEAEKRYASIGGASPIYASTQRQKDALEKELQRRGRNFEVIFSFNYSDPLPCETIKEVKRRGKKFLMTLSLYPHYSKATTGSNLYYLRKEAQSQFPAVQFINAASYYLHDGYIQAFAERIREQLKNEEILEDFYLLFSAHGLPLYFLTEGDVYPFHISQTVAQILAKFNRRQNWSISYQSAVGPLQWLKPATEEMISALAKRGVKKLLVIPVSFVTDHIETLCEIDIEYRQLALTLGITDFRMMKAVEAHPEFVRALADSVEDSLPQSNRSSQPSDSNSMLCDMTR